MEFDIAFSVKTRLWRYYQAKKLAGNTYDSNTVCHLMKSKYVYQISPFVEHKLNLKGPSRHHFMILEPRLVKRKYALKFFDTKLKSKFKYLAYLHDRHITGTCLYMFFNKDGEQIPFWKFPEYGNDENFFSHNVEEEHLNPNLKNYDQVVLYLNYLKELFNRK